MGFAIFVVILFAIISYWVDRRRYEKTSYYQITHHDYWSVKRDSGTRGEYILFKKLQFLEANGCKMLHNLYLQIGGKTQELDLLLITDRGLFAVESKNYSGWIFGNEDNIYWTQTLPNGKNKARKEKFYNPIMQNRKHCEFLEKCINEENIPIFSVIVFGDNCEIKDVTVKSDNVIVCVADELPYLIMQVLENRMQRYESSKIEALYKRLYPYSQADEQTKQQHLQNAVAAKNSRSIQKRVQTESVANEHCPKCGGILLVKQNKRAGYQYIECSNAPKCKYIVGGIKGL